MCQYHEPNNWTVLVLEVYLEDMRFDLNEW